MICDCFLCEFNTSGMIFKFSILASSHSFSVLCTFKLLTKELGAKLVVDSHHLYVQQYTLSDPYVFPSHHTHHHIITSINPSSYLAITKSTQLTPVQASSTYIQMSGDRGLRKENTPGLVPLGLRYRMLIPKVMKGLEKSMTFSLT